MSLKVIFLQLFVLSSIGLSAHGQEKPNIIFIFADDLGNYISPHPKISFITVRWQRYRQTKQQHPACLSLSKPSNAIDGTKGGDIYLLQPLQGVET